MDKLMHNLILKKLAARCEFPKFDCVNYLENNFLSMFNTPKHLKLIAGGMPSGDFVNNPLEGYRTLVTNKITQTQPTTKNPQGQGGARKAGV
ncbi:MAG: hypothetical protein COX41_01085 [Candidatus Omnitrophica bacterium CG23_combo_of_CG06-09_8_20_14_all_41_10]|uniref:Uncharacterized protein n=1 Tax=Candidatus Sherwoodlollariibacterium unditelluris TaxID=1974757 RepID=A0A2G9YKX1_9BACT|nr:MAG: hypothetical protein COX41_01085 [Candidatus Omnitrophica bacterium CG23_combo_of_CG06-09_8_20_14_all_41_10]